VVASSGEPLWRAICQACRRPASVCYCRHVVPVETRTRVVVLQHPCERDKPIGTARMATLCLPEAELHEGVRWDAGVLDRVLADPTGRGRPPVLLYPGPGAIDVMRHPPEAPVTLVVVDGTWWQAKKLVRENPRLAALPRYAFTPEAPTEYRIRKEPRETYVSTIEALVYVLGALERDPGRFRDMLLPFRAMIDAQIACEREHHGSRIRHARMRMAKKPSRPAIPPELREGPNGVVCVVGEANAWPYRAREHGAVYADELVHWVGYRLGTGERFERVVAPRGPLAPRTSSYVELSPPELAAGVSVGQAVTAWRSFVRETDVVCFWGHYGAALFAESGGYLPQRRIDLRTAARVFAKAKVGTLDELVERLGLSVSAPLAGGRAGRRLSQVTSIAAHFVALGAVYAEH
jgi:DTW domain-containing protein YfiP